MSEEEGADAVRLLTIHAAKGLEFKVVVVADAGRDLGGPPPADEILALSDGRFGFKVVHPTSGERKAVFGYDEVLDAEREAGRAERLRLYYVAMTRAVDRLLVSGAVGEARDTPIGWVLSKLDCEAGARRRGHRVRARARRRLVPRARRPRERAGARASKRPRAGEGPAGAVRRAPVDPAGPRLAPARARAGAASRALHHVRQLSYSALALFQRCSYRYYAERVAGLRERRAAPTESVGLAATEIGDAAHRLLEVVDMRESGDAQTSTSFASGTRT